MDTTKIPEEAMKPFTAEEILNHPEFADFVQAEINMYNNNKTSATMAAGMRLRRTPYDALKEKNLLNSFAVIAEFDKICRKTCMLSSLQRSAIDQLIINAADRMMKAVDARDKAEKDLLDKKAKAAIKRAEAKKAKAINTNKLIKQLTPKP